MQQIIYLGSIYLIRQLTVDSGTYLFLDIDVYCNFPLSALLEVEDDSSFWLSPSLWGPLLFRSAVRLKRVRILYLSFTNR